VAGIDFTRAEVVVDNVRAALAAGTRYVVGTTGWHAQLPEVQALVERAGGGLVHAANFSVGVNLFYRIVRDAAQLMAGFPEYDPYVVEKHHRQKKDAPSGTARALAAILEGASGRRAETQLAGALPEKALHVAAVRAGGIVGEHTVGFDAGVDEILLEHRARSRRGFAAGSVLAAEWIATRTGFHSFEAVLDDRVRSRP
jgi:4-hydroxy-tetrahydrodipicolinate reductase